MYVLKETEYYELLLIFWLGKSWRDSTEKSSADHDVYVLDGPPELQRLLPWPLSFCTHVPEQVVYGWNVMYLDSWSVLKKVCKFIYDLVTIAAMEVFVVCRAVWACATMRVCGWKWSSPRNSPWRVHKSSIDPSLLLQMCKDIDHPVRVFIIYVT